MLSKQEEEQERREVLENDQRVREQQQAQGGTFYQHGLAQALDLARGGRTRRLSARLLVCVTSMLNLMRKMRRIAPNASGRTRS